MRAPRRVPWASKGELGELYEFLFSPSADAKSITRGISRVCFSLSTISGLYYSTIGCCRVIRCYKLIEVQMNIYISSPSCPAFMHLLYTLINASILISHSFYLYLQTSQLFEQHEPKQYQTFRIQTFRTYFHSPQPPSIAEHRFAPTSPSCKHSNHGRVSPPP